MRPSERLPAARPGWARLGRRFVDAPTPLVFVSSLLLATALLWRQGTLADLGAVARGADRAVAAGAFVLYLLGLALLSARWHLLVRMVRGGAESDAARAAEAFLTSVVVNYAAPIGLAVPTRAMLTKRSLGLSPAATGSLALWEVAADILILGLGTLAWLVTNDVGGDALGSAGTGDPWTLAALGVTSFVVAVLAGIVAVRWPRLRRRAWVAATDMLRYPGRRPRDAGLALGVTVVYWLIQGVVLRLLLGAAGVGDGPALGLVLGLVSLPVLVGMLSPVPGGAGVREALMVAVAQGHGASGAAVLLAAVAYRAALFVAVPILYIAVRLWLLARGARTSDATRRGDV